MMRARVPSAHRPLVAALFLASSALSALALLPAPASAITTVAVIVPVGGEVWSGGSTHDVVWDLGTDTNNDVLVEYLLDGVPTEIERRMFVLPGRYTTSWTVPAIDHGNATIRVCATDVAPWECATSPPFAVDNTRPILTSRAPEGANVPLDEPLFLTFSEDLNAPSLIGSFSVSPGVGNLTWGAVKRDATILHDPFLPGTTYQATIPCAATDASDPGLPFEGCPITWSFRTSARPAISVLSPAAGDSWSGGSVHAVRWSASDPEDATSDLQVFLEFAADGTAWSPLAGPLPGDGSYDWAVPAVDAPDARVRARVVDTRGLEADAVSAPFRIDATPPRITATSPPDGASGVGWTAPVIVEFSEPVVGPLDGNTFHVRTAAGAPVPGTLAWETPQRFRFTPSTPYEALTAYIARLEPALRDASDPGNPVAAAEWRFVTKPNGAPSIAFTARPAGVISGSSTWTIAWAASDPDDVAEDLAVYLGFFDGTSSVPLAGPLSGTSSYLWTAPAADVPAASLLLRVVDSQGGEASAAIGFAIDATPPRILAATPGPGAADVPPTATLVIEYSEPMEENSVSVGLREAATGAWVPTQWAWDADSRVLRLLPLVPLRELAEYEVVANAGRDRSSPGNSLAAAAWTFRVASFPPVVAILSPGPGARWSAGVPQVLRITAADALDPTVLVRADLQIGGDEVELLPPTAVPPGERTFTVSPPNADASATIRVCARDGSGAEACATGTLVLDGTRPRVLAAVPAATARSVHPDAPIRITFSESMDPASVEASFTLNPASPVTFRWGRANAENDTLLVEHPRLSEWRAYTFAIGCGARDASSPGLPVAGPCPLAWTFTTAATPDVRLLAPSGGERITADAGFAVRWTSADDEPFGVTTLELSVDDGTTYPYVLLDAAPIPTGDAIRTVPLPAIDAAAARVRVTVRDSLGLAATALSEPFAIDASPPRILSTAPADGAVEVSPLADVVITFSESMDPASLDRVRATAAFRGALVTWSQTNAPFDTLRISHAAVRLGASVRVPLDDLRDASAPGNAFTGSVSYTVLPDREPPTVALAVAAEASEGEVVVLDASASKDNDEIADFLWSVREDGRDVARFRGSRVEWRASPGAYEVSVEVVDASGNRAEASTPLLVHARGPDARGALPSETVTLFGWLALAGAGGSSAYSLTDRGRSFLSRVILLPLYTKLKGPAVLDNETRGMIRGYIRVNPGDCYTDLLRNLGLSNGELAYHLSVLEREGIIRSTTRGARRVYYPAEAEVPENGGGLHEVQRRILKHVSEVPGMTVRDLAGVLGVSHQLAHYHARKLGEAGLLRFERRNLVIRVYATTEEERRRLPARGNT